MCKKSPAVNFVYKKIRTTRKSEMLKLLEESPLTAVELSFMQDIIAGLSITELSEKHFKSPSRISQWKREVCEKIHAFEIANAMH